jgi:hypothetical protein
LAPVTDSASIALGALIVAGALALRWWELRQKGRTPESQQLLLDAFERAERLRKTNPSAADQVISQAEAEFASHDQQERVQLQTRAPYDSKARAALLRRLHMDLNAIARLQKHLQANRSTIPRVGEGLKYYADRERRVCDQIAAVKAFSNRPKLKGLNGTRIGTDGALRLFRSIVGLGSAGIMAHAVDKGMTSAWSTWQKGAWFLAMVGLGSFGLGPVLRFLGNDERLAWMPLLIMFWLALVYPIAWQLQLRLGIPLFSTYLIAFALTFAYSAWRRAWWLWNDPNQWLSDALGDRVAQILYLVFAMLLIVVAIIYASK